MYFKTFTLGTNTEQQIKKAGFRVNSYQEIKTFQGCKEENISLKPRDYYFDGSIWEIIDVPDFSERIILMCRMPMLAFQELWHLYLNGDKEDRFGALSIIANQYANDLIAEIRSTTEEQGSHKSFRKRLLELKADPIITNCSCGKRIVSAIEDLDFSG